MSYGSLVVGFRRLRGCDVGASERRSEVGGGGSVVGG
jgi:hypothetical protein